MIFTDSIMMQILIAAIVFFLFYISKKRVSNFLFSTINTMTLKTKTQLDDTIAIALKKPFELFWLVIAFYIVVEIITFPKALESIINNCVESAFTFVLFSVLFSLTAPLSNIIVVGTSKLGSKSLGKDLSNLITRFIQVIIVALGIITILQAWGYNITGFLASLGLVGMAIALAAKDTVANLFGSLVIFSDKPFKIGDWIKTPNAEGIVEAVGIRSTKIRTFAQALISVPNATLANSEILNWSRMGKRRIKMNLGLTYDTSTIQMSDILDDIRKMLKDDQNIHQETIHIYFTDFNDSSLGIFCYFFTKSTNWAEYMRVKEDVNLKIMKIIENNNAAFAFPSQSIYLENENEIN